MNKCILCGNQTISLVKEVDTNTVNYCEHCSMDEKTSKFVDQANCDIMTLSDIECIARTVVMTIGHYGDVVTKVFVDEIEICSLDIFLRRAREDGSLYILLDGQPICRDYSISKNGVRKIKLITLKEGM